MIDTLDIAGLVFLGFLLLWAVFGVVDLVLWILKK